jgi:formylglycine-generating enzyme required for sulfatase activity/tetratricopeptide (TPR) repeat protein
MPDQVAVAATKYSRHFIVKLILLLLLVSITFQRAPAQQPAVPQKQPAEPAQKKQPQNPQPKPLTAQQIFKRVSPSIFVVEALDSTGATIALGSGVSVDPLSDTSAFAVFDQIAGCPARSLGYSHQVVTNRHVVKGSVTVRLRQADKTWPAQIVYTDPEHDLCVLQVDNLRAPSPKLRKSSELAVGERVYAIGAPNGLELSISDGLISGLRDYEGSRVVQTTAAVSPGSSGGGLFDSQGRLIGITSFSASEGQNLNFALPTEFIASACSASGAAKMPGGENARLADEELKLGESAANKELYEVAVKHLKEAVRLKPDMLHAWTRLGLAFEGMKRYEDAIAAYKEAIRLSNKKLEDEKKKNSAEWIIHNEAVFLAWQWGLLGDAYSHAGHMEQATVAHQEAVGIAPDSALCWCQLGADYGRTARYEDAIRVMKEALRLFPEMCNSGISFCCSNLALVYEKLGKYQEAREIRNRSQQQAQIAGGPGGGALTLSLPEPIASSPAVTGSSDFVKNYVSVVREALWDLSTDPAFAPFGERMLAQLASGLDAAGLSDLNQSTGGPSLAVGGRLTQEGVRQASEFLRTAIQNLSTFPAFVPFGERMLAQLEAGLKHAQTQPMKTTGAPEVRKREVAQEEERKQAEERRRVVERKWEFVKIPPGEFDMGCSPSDTQCYEDEKPQHHVRISKGFEIGKYLVTQAMWESVMGSNPSTFKGADRPVERVSWNDVQEFLWRMNAKNDGYRYRLSTEAEWEYAARAGRMSARYGELDTIAWYDGNSGNDTHPVGQKQANAWGLYDMLGNVFEWVQDWYDENYYQQSLGTDPQGPSSGENHIVRGGSSGFNARDVRASVRFSGAPDNRILYIGFRCVREAAE